jgi:peptidoglycan/LPS O-acetylase OafA/YrhL
MLNTKKIFDNLRRVTTSSLFIPEIDGLRFIAISWVVLYHVNIFVINKNPLSFLRAPESYSWIYGFIANGYRGVFLFFVISGFILALPFAKQYIHEGKKVILKNYYKRRLTRLEPPYVITMVLCFIFLILKHRYTFDQLLPSLMASLVYLHNYIPSGPHINNVIWTLEIEVQFYLIAPLLSNLFRLKEIYRRSLLFSLIVLSIILQKAFPQYAIGLLGYLHYFLAGFLLVDLYLENHQFSLHKTASALAGLVLFFAIIYMNISTSIGTFLFLSCIFIFYFLVMNDKALRKIFSFKWLTVIGGMCYSIYLWHYIVISAIGNESILMVKSHNYIIALLSQCLILIPGVLIYSIFFYLLIERPCMDKNWPVKLIGFIRNINFVKYLFNEQKDDNDIKIR